MGNLFTRNASTILTCIGAVGVVATSVMTAKATPKALTLLRNAEFSKGDALTKAEQVRIAGPAYIPAIATGAATIACIFGANAVSKHQQATLMSAYALLDRSYKNYKRKVDELYGEGADARVTEEVAKERYKLEAIEVGEGRQLFYDQTTDRYFETTVDKMVWDDGLECYIISCGKNY